MAAPTRRRAKAVALTAVAAALALVPLLAGEVSAWVSPLRLEASALGSDLHDALAGEFAATVAEKLDMPPKPPPGPWNIFLAVFPVGPYETHNEGMRRASKEWRKMTPEDKRPFLLLWAELKEAYEASQGLTRTASSSAARARWTLSWWWKHIAAGAAIPSWKSCLRLALPLDGAAPAGGGTSGGDAADQGSLGTSAGPQVAEGVPLLPRLRVRGLRRCGHDGEARDGARSGWESVDQDDWFENLAHLASKRQLGSLEHKLLPQVARETEEWRRRLSELLVLGTNVTGNAARTTRERLLNVRGMVRRAKKTAPPDARRSILALLPTNRGHRVRRIGNTNLRWQVWKVLYPTDPVPEELIPWQAKARRRRWSEKAKARRRRSSEKENEEKEDSFSEWENVDFGGFTWHPLAENWVHTEESELWRPF